MVTINRILCPVDFSGHSRVALDYATTLARWYDAEITALHAYAVAMLPATISAFPAAGSVGLPLTREEVERDLNRFLQPVVATGIPLRSEIVVGSPAKGILESADRLPASLIVMGTHGASGVERLMLGSVTEKVLRKATCPVLIVTRDADAPSGSPVLFRRILCAVDFSPCSNHALSYALSLAEEAGGALTMLHVLESFAEEPLTYAQLDLAEYQRHAEALALERLNSLVPRETRTWCRCTPMTRFGKPYQEILTVASELQVDLVVLGVRGRNPIDLAIFGSTTNHVVRSAGCPVLTVRS
jgi:nucleotide-binding universal stress UspA family protein